MRNWIQQLIAERLKPFKAHRETYTHTPEKQYPLAGRVRTKVLLQYLQFTAMSIFPAAMSHECTFAMRKLTTYKRFSNGLLTLWFLFVSPEFIVVLADYADVKPKYLKSNPLLKIAFKQKLTLNDTEPWTTHSFE